MQPIDEHPAEHFNHLNSNRHAIRSIYAHRLGRRRLVIDSRSFSAHPNAARDLTARLTPRLQGQAMRMLQDRAEAEDVAQEAMLRLWRVAPDWRQGEAQVSTWAYRVVSNLCMDRLRKRRPVGLDQIAEPDDGAPSVADQMQTASRLRILITIIRRSSIPCTWSACAWV